MGNTCKQSLKEAIKCRYTLFLSTNIANIQKPPMLGLELVRFCMQNFVWRAAGLIQTCFKKKKKKVPSSLVRVVDLKVLKTSFEAVRNTRPPIRLLTDTYGQRIIV